MQFLGIFLLGLLGVLLFGSRRVLMRLAIICAAAVTVVALVAGSLYVQTANRAAAQHAAECAADLAWLRANPNPDPFDRMIHKPDADCQP